MTFDALNWTKLDVSLLNQLIPGLFILPFVLCSATSGQLADKFEKGGMARKVKLLEIFIMCLADYGWMTHNMWVLVAGIVGMGIHSRISKSKKEDYPTIEEPFFVTMVVINQPWVDLPDNPFGQPEIKAKGGEAIWLACTLVFLFGNQKKGGVNQIEATKNGRKVVFATRTKISVLKNHVNGLSYKDGKILAVHNGYIEDTKESLEEYKKTYSNYWNAQLTGTGEILYDESEVLISEE